MLKIDCYLSITCASEEALRRNIEEALRMERLEAALDMRRIDEKEAGRLGLRGSPSIFINGVEVQPVSQPGFT
ncbi:MAG: hypothetical protein M0033_06615 [Nitrospiraceae bacterium]|nr:hypothetical protein [Nitrospiraceae bacterium]MDA8325876.1 hypothetical protein [Nitrospiraceae bacterium]